jgi:hypothetical protein
MQLEQQPATIAFSSRSGSIHCRHEHPAGIRHAARLETLRLISPQVVSCAAPV